MKKLLSLLIVCLIMFSALVGCSTKNKTSLLDMMSGTDAAKLLLAEERLNAQLLKNEGNIFENGIKVMNDLAKIAVANLGVRYTGGSTASMMKISSAKTLSTVLEGDYIGKVEIDGNRFFWSEFEENNNSYDYFKSITDNIVYTAEIGAELIDSVKKNVRVVDKWVDMGFLHYYLHVDENSEILCERDTENSILKICKRYKNEDGKDVYELYRRQEDYEERMTYIPGERYELSMISDYGEGSEDYFLADNSKGYWETYIVGVAPQHYNVSYFIMKNDICYDAFYDPQNGNIPLLKIMSSDKATDILNFFDGEGSSSVDLKFSGFDGIQSVEAPASSVDYTVGQYANLTGGEDSKVHLTNGKTLHYGDTFADGKVDIRGIHVGYGVAGYTGEIILNITGETYEERLITLKSFLDETGFRCRRDLNTVFAGIDRAYIELESIIKYYKWNGISVTDEDGIADAIHEEKDRFGDMEAIYTEIEDAEVLDYSNTELIELNINFAPITAKNADNVRLNGTNVTVGSLFLTITDTTLYVKDEPYKVAFAMVSKNGSGGLVHLDVDNTATISYADQAEFTVSANDVSFELPILAVGDYTVVAYISTSDGIRASEYIAIDFDSVSETPVKIERISMSAKVDSDGEITVSYAEITDFTVSLTSAEKLDYGAFRELIAAEAFKYGTPSDGALEIQSGEEYISLSGTETEIADGTYRIGYSLQNGDLVTEGYIYIKYVYMG